MFQSIASFWPLLCWDKINVQQASCQFSRRLQNVIAMHAGKVLYTSCTGKRVSSGQTAKCQEQLFYRDSVLTFKCQNDLVPQYLTSKFTKRSNIHTRNTRMRNSLQILLYRTAIGQRTFSYRGANIWNNLHNELRQSASLASFKRAVKDTLLWQTFPS